MTKISTRDTWSKWDGSVYVSRQTIGFRATADPIISNIFSLFPLIFNQVCVFTVSIESAILYSIIALNIFPSTAKLIKELNDQQSN